MKCIFCQPEEDAKEVGDGDICDECVKRGLKQGWLNETEGD